MKLAISNIAWPDQDTLEILEMVKKMGCQGIEVALSRIWPEPAEADKRRRLAYLDMIEDCGLSVVSVHSLLYAKSRLGLFKDAVVERETIEYIKKLILLASDLKAGVLVFGSPNSRKRGDIPLDEAFSRAADFFAPIAKFAAEQGRVVVIEPLSREETDFINSSTEGIRLVKMVNSPGLQLHLDAKAIIAQGNDIGSILAEAMPYFKHFHINDPGLAEVGSIADYHQTLGAALKKSGYQGFVSIEMREFPDYKAVINRSIEVAKRYY